MTAINCVQEIKRLNNAIEAACQKDEKAWANSEGIGFVIECKPGHLTRLSEQILKESAEKAFAEVRDAFREAVRRHAADAMKKARADAAIEFASIMSGQ